MTQQDKVELFCEWCGHRDIYFVGVGDQPKCKKCFRFIPKKQKFKEE